MQDAHEFLNYLLNECSELLEKEAKAKSGALPNGLASNGHAQQHLQQRQQSGQQASTSAPAGAGPAAAQQPQPKPPPTFIQEIFQVRAEGLLCSRCFVRGAIVHCLARQVPSLSWECCTAHIEEAPPT